MASVIDRADNRTDFIKACMALGLSQMEKNPLEKGTEVLERMEFDSSMEKNTLPYSGVEIPCGPPTECMDMSMDNESLIDLLGIKPDRMYMMRAKGDSMIDAGIDSGDRIIIDVSNRYPTPDQIAVCQLNGEYTLKHFKMMNGYALLIPDNPDFPEIRVEKGDDFHVWGVLYMILKKAKGA